MSVQVAILCLLCWTIGACYGWIRHEEATLDRPLYKILIGVLPINV